MSDQIEKQLGALHGELTPVRDLARRFIDDTTVIDPPSGATLISHRPKIAPQAFALVLFPGATEDFVARYEAVQAKKLPSRIPSVNKCVLSRLNGASLFEIDLYGLSMSMSQSPPVLNRSMQQPLDLATANSDWSRQYRAMPGQLHFGSGPFSYAENLGYFLNANKSVEARRVGGERFGHWDSFEGFLAEEIKRAEELFPAFEERQFEFRQKLEARQRSPKHKNKR